MHGTKNRFGAECAPAKWQVGKGDNERAPTSELLRNDGLPAQVRLDHGVCFFDTSCRKTFSLYTDASGIGLGGYYMPGTGPIMPGDVPLANAFAVPLSRPPQSSLAPFDINIFEMEAINFALQAWGPVWASSIVRVFTDNKTSELGLIKQTLRSPTNTPLRQALLQAAALDIVLEPIWIPGTSNTLADALSRFDRVTIANLCPHWQDFSFSTLQQRFTPG
jgi:hypothetical protein